MTSARELNMKIFRYPSRDRWPEIVKRPVADTKAIEASVRAILNDVQLNGDEALLRYTKQFDLVELGEFTTAEQEFIDAEKRVPKDLKAAIRTAKANIERFHAAQREKPVAIETTAGVVCWRRSVAIDKVGLYVPAGTASLFSTVLMLGVPAQIAGSNEIVLCSPPDPNGSIDDAILYAAKVCGITKVFKVGGAQAIAALAYGTESVPRVYKIFGPGNHFVTCAKQMVSNEVAIDMPAGPSEVAVLTDGSCNPAFVAADLLSQAEHGPDSQVILVTTSEPVIENTLAEIEQQIARLPRREIAERSLANSRAFLVGDIDEGIDLINDYAAEHLILAIENAEQEAEKITNAGSVFLGNYSCESAGDYASGTNHTLPTGGFARSFSGVSLDSFVKKITFQKLTADGIRNLGPAIECMARAEGLEAHRQAVSVRLEEINGL